MKAAIYLRSSTMQPGNPEQSVLQNQEQACRELIGRCGGAVAGVYADTGEPAAGVRKLGHSQALDSLLNDATCGCFDTVVVYRLDRLARTLAEMARCLCCLEQAGTHIVTVKDHVNVAMSDGNLQAYLLFFGECLASTMSAA